NGAENYNMVSQLWTQAKGSIFTILFTVIVTTVILVIIKKTVGLRVDDAEESLGLDQSAHGETAYND
ncbi:MAG: ammonia channel protein, partial [Verrucomicrobiaceae bacterium]|nr:ammonia channel protein [Verrucomicrobiaceae bacterium]